MVPSTDIVDLLSSESSPGPLEYLCSSDNHPRDVWPSGNKTAGPYRRLLISIQGRDFHLWHGVGENNGNLAYCQQGG